MSTASSPPATASGIRPCHCRRTASSPPAIRVRSSGSAGASSARRSARSRRRSHRCPRPPPGRSNGRRSDAVQLTILGCSGTFPGPLGPCSSYLLEFDGFRLLLDVGNGALGPLQARVGLLGVDAVLLSHLHGDHCLDLIAYSYARRYHPEGPLPKLPVYGPRHTQQRLCGAFEDWPEDGLCDVYDFRDLAPGRRAIGPFSIVMDRVSHPIEAYAFRVEAEGRSLTYSGDSGSSDNLDQLASGSDLFLCEAS